MKGVCLGVPKPEDLSIFLRVIESELPPRGFDTLVLLIRYAFPFRSHPDVSVPGGISLDGFRQIADACRQSGIRLIPKMNLLGHQSGRERGTEDGLLQAYPQFDETPDLDSVRYCRSLCPRHPDVKDVVRDLIDEMIGAFRADAFHVGCDEVFEIGHCPRCRGASNAELFAEWIIGLHEHIVGRQGAEMLMWGDRLLDGQATGYGEWEASLNDTHAAADMIPTDIICCDWHYTKRPDYPSIPLLTGRGFRTVVSPWRDVEATRALLAAAEEAQSDRLMGVLQTSWCDSGEVCRAILNETAVPDGTPAEVAASIEAVAAGTVGDASRT